MAAFPLPPLVPPLRYCLVEEGLYRGAYPSLINLRFMTRLGLRSMVSLLPEPPAPHLIAWCEEHGICNHFECVKIPLVSARMLHRCCMFMACWS